MLFKSKQSHRSDAQQELRKYIRIDGVFPVEFTIVRLQGDLPGIDWSRGLTRNISEGGICLETAELDESTINFLRQQNIYLELKMPVPPTKPPIRAVAEIAWIMKAEGASPLFLIGLKFRSISSTELKRLLWHAQMFSISLMWVMWMAVVIFSSAIIWLVIDQNKEPDTGISIEVMKNGLTNSVSFEEKAEE
jgi:hypothetical protein